jgi:predicted nuclease with TOPRIM domain
MSELNSIPQKTTVEIETVKLDEAVLKNLTELNQKSTNIINEFGQIYIRKDEIHEEMARLDDFLQTGKEEFKAINLQLKEVIDSLDDKYPQGRINLKDGTIQYQPGALSRKQIAEQQKQQMANGSNDMKVVN